MSTLADAVTLDDALEDLSALVRGDGIELHRLSWDSDRLRVEVAVDLAGVECLDCVLPPAALREVVRDGLHRRVPGDYEVVLRDPRASDDLAAPAAGGVVLVLDPTGRAADGDPDPGPDAGPLAGRRVGFRVDVLWRSWDWVTDEWTSALQEAGAEVTSFRHAQGAAGDAGRAHHAAHAAFLGSVEVSIVGLGNCGSCTSWTIRDAVAAADAGHPTVAVVTEQFEVLGRTLARQYGRPNLRFLVLPYPLDTRPEPEVREIARRELPELLRVLGAEV